MPADAPRIKICGLTDAGGAAACADLGIWGIGVVFAAESPRRVSPEAAAAILASVPARFARVGVFVAADPGAIAEVAAGCRLTHVQVHGTADPLAVGAACGLPVIEAIAMDGPTALERARRSAADLVLLDASVPGRHGGTGHTFDWDLLAGRSLGRPWMLAGGLTARNVGAAVRALRPDFVDVSSGVESAPGRKDITMAAEFVAGVAGAGRRAA